jgi:glycosyltransferase involved in cell wall biosynthesis
MVIKVITPHQRGERDVFLNRLEYYINRQTLRPDEWIIVDHDTGHPMDLTERVRIGLNRAKDADLILIMENDDWYSPTYIETMVRAWVKRGTPDLIGYDSTWYYHIKSEGYHLLNHPKRASLMATAIAGSAVDKIQFPADDFTFLDLELWRQLQGVAIEDTPECVGIKHGIGNTGGVGHRENWKLYEQDSNYSKLYDLIGDDATYYVQLATGNPDQSSRKTIAIVTGVWQRPEVFELFANGVDYLIKHTNYNYHVIVAGSEGDKSRSMVERRGYTYIEVPNQPLATKMNATIQQAARMGFDYCLCLGSDDVVHPSLMQAYAAHIKSGIDFIGVTDFYFYDIASGRSAYWGGYRELYRKGHTAGAARLLSNRLLKAWNYSPWEIRHSNGLDNSMQEKLKITPHTTAILSMRACNAFALDIKSATNMTPFELWDNTSYINTDIISNKFQYLNL